MPQEHSFDIVSKIDFQEVENALGQTRKEIATRYDFKNCHVEITREKEKITVVADDEFRLRASLDILQTKFIKRAVPVKNIEFSDQEAALGGTVRQTLNVRSGLSPEICKEIVKAIKSSKSLKVTPSVQGDYIRASGKSKDSLQRLIGVLKTRDFGLDLQFTNYR